MTGQIYPKILPRNCFPMEPDKHMVQWYESVSDRLRQEAEEEEIKSEVDQADVQPFQIRTRYPHMEGVQACFSNPLGRQAETRSPIYGNAY